MWFQIILIMCCILVFETHGGLIMKPNNRVSRHGDEVVFNCQSNSTSESIFWSYTKTGGGFLDGYYIYRSRRILRGRSSRFDVSVSSSGVHRFVIKSVTQADAGVHVFEDNNGYGKRYEFELIVLESNPSCQRRKYLDETTNKEILNISCSVRYTGKLSPVFSWSDVSGRVLESLQNVSSKSENNVIVSYFDSVFSTSATDSTSAFCAYMYFDAPAAKSTTNVEVASNVPDYRFYWPSSEAVVLQVCRTVTTLPNHRSSSHLPNPEAIVPITAPASKLDLIRNEKYEGRFYVTVPSGDPNYISNDHNLVVTYIQTEKFLTGNPSRKSAFGAMFLVIIVSGSCFGIIAGIFIIACVMRKIRKESKVEFPSGCNLEASERLYINTRHTSEKNQCYEPEYAEINECEIEINNKSEIMTKFEYETSILREMPSPPVYIQLFHEHPLYEAV